MKGKKGIILLIIIIVLIVMGILMVVIPKIQLNKAVNYIKDGEYKAA